MSRRTTLSTTIFNEETLNVMMSDLKSQIIASEDIEKMEDLMSNVKVIKGELNARKQGE